MVSEEQPARERRLSVGHWPPAVRERHLRGEGRPPAGAARPFVVEDCHLVTGWCLEGRWCLAMTLRSPPVEWEGPLVSMSPLVVCPPVVWKWPCVPVGPLVVWKWPSVSGGPLVVWAWPVVEQLQAVSVRSGETGWSPAGNGMPLLYATTPAGSGSVCTPITDRCSRIPVCQLVVTAAP